MKWAVAKQIYTAFFKVYKITNDFIYTCRFENKIYGFFRDQFYCFKKLKY